MAQALTHAPTAFAPFPQSPSVQDAYSRFVAAITATTPHYVGCCADALDIEERAQHVSEVLDAVERYLGHVIRDTSASSARHVADMRDAADQLSDCASDVAGTMHAAANAAWCDEPRRVA